MDQQPTNVIPMPATFDGSEGYVPERDQAALTGQLHAVFHLMRDGKWRTLYEVAEAVDCGEATASARLRDLRKRKNGNYRVDRKHLGNRLYVYRLVLEGGVEQREN